MAYGPSDRRHAQGAGGGTAGLTGRRLADHLVDFLLPPTCLGCRTRLPLEASGDLVCQTCRTRLRAIPAPRCPRCSYPLGTGRAASRPCGECRDWPPALGRAISACVLEPPADALVHQLKYQGWRELAGVMAEFMYRALKEATGLRSSTFLVPVPTTRRRLKRRGYNQATVLAGALAEKVGGDVVEALERRPSGGTQVALHPSQRAANVQTAFRPRGGVFIPYPGAPVTLVDDVLTTGATAVAAADALQAAGAGQVTLITFARALPGRG